MVAIQDLFVVLLLASGNLVAAAPIDNVVEKRQTLYSPSRTVIFPTQAPPPPATSVITRKTTTEPVTFKPPPVTSAKPPVTSVKPPVTSVKPPVTTAKPPTPKPTPKPSSTKKITYKPEPSHPHHWPPREAEAQLEERQTLYSPSRTVIYPVPTPTVIPPVSTRKTTTKPVSTKKPTPTVTTPVITRKTTIKPVSTKKPRPTYQYPPREENVITFSRTSSTEPVTFITSTARPTSSTKSSSSSVVKPSTSTKPTPTPSPTRKTIEIPLPTGRPSAIFSLLPPEPTRHWGKRQGFELPPVRTVIVDHPTFEDPVLDG